MTPECPVYRCVTKLGKSYCASKVNQNEVYLESCEGVYSCDVFRILNMAKGSTIECQSNINPDEKSPIYL